MMYAIIQENSQYKIYTSTFAVHFDPVLKEIFENANLKALELPTWPICHMF